MDIFTIAELSANHNNDIEIAKKSIIEIAKTGANAIKLQTYTSKCLTLNIKNDHFKIKNGLWENQYYHDLYTRASTPWEWHEELFSLAKDVGLICFSSPFSIEGVRFLSSLECPIYKIASFEIAHTGLLKAIASTKKRVILSLGIANQLELFNALHILRNNEKITLLHCISEYPADFKNASLDKLVKVQILIQDKFKDFNNIDFGLSDHTLDNRASIIALALGARTFEKHFIIDKNMPSPDKEFSLNANEFKKFVDDLKDSKYALNNFSLRDILGEDKEVKLRDEESSLQNFKLDSLSLKDAISLIQKYEEKSKHTKGRQHARSIFVKNNIRAGEKFSLDNLACVRPYSGLSPLYLDLIINKVSLFDLAAGSPLKLSHIKID